eukprot:Rmarinus@m.9745
MSFGELYSHKGTFHLKKVKNLIGRADDVDIYLDSKSVSQHHALIACLGGAFYLQDLDSRNGCFVNGSRLTSGGKCELRLHDTVRFGFDMETFVLLPHELESRGVGSGAVRQPEGTTRPASRTTRRRMKARATSPPFALDPPEKPSNTAKSRNPGRSRVEERSDVETRAAHVPSRRAEDSGTRASYDAFREGLSEGRRWAESVAGAHQGGRHQPQPQPQQARENSSAGWSECVRVLEGRERQLEIALAEARGAERATSASAIAPGLGKVLEKFEKRLENAERRASSRQGFVDSSMRYGSAPAAVEDHLAPNEYEEFDEEVRLGTGYTEGQDIAYNNPSMYSPGENRRPRMVTFAGMAPSPSSPTARVKSPVIKVETPGGVAFDLRKTPTPQDMPPTFDNRLSATPNDPYFENAAHSRVMQPSPGQPSSPAAAARARSSSLPSPAVHEGSIPIPHSMDPPVAPSPPVLRSPSPLCASGRGSRTAPTPSPSIRPESRQDNLTPADSRGRMTPNYQSSNPFRVDASVSPIYPPSSKMDMLSVAVGQSCPSSPAIRDRLSPTLHPHMPVSAEENPIQPPIESDRNSGQDVLRDGIFSDGIGEEAVRKLITLSNQVSEAVTAASRSLRCLCSDVSLERKQQPLRVDVTAPTEPSLDYAIQALTETKDATESLANSTDSALDRLVSYGENDERRAGDTLRQTTDTATLNLLERRQKLRESQESERGTRKPIQHARGPPLEEEGAHSSNKRLPNVSSGEQTGRSSGKTSTATATITTSASAAAASVATQGRRVSTAKNAAVAEPTTGLRGRRHASAGHTSPKKKRHASDVDRLAKKVRCVQLKQLCTKELLNSCKSQRDAIFNEFDAAQGNGHGFESQQRSEGVASGPVSAAAQALRDMLREKDRVLQTLDAHLAYAFDGGLPGFEGRKGGSDLGFASQSIISSLSTKLKALATPSSTSTSLRKPDPRGTGSWSALESKVQALQKDIECETRRLRENARMYTALVEHSEASLSRATQCHSRVMSEYACGQPHLPRSVSQESVPVRTGVTSQAAAVMLAEQVQQLTELLSNPVEIQLATSSQSGEKVAQTAISSLSFDLDRILGRSLPEGKRFQSGYADPRSGGLPTHTPPYPPEQVSEQGYASADADAADALRQRQGDLEDHFRALQQELLGEQASLSRIKRELRGTNTV